MKNIINCFFKVNLGLLFVISSNLSNVSALDYTNDQDTIFPKEEVNEPGVEIGPNNWNTSKNQAYAVTVKDTTSKQDVSAADYCYSQLGKPYNWNFYRMDYRNKFYCSQLIRSAYLDLYDIDLNTGDFDILTGKAIHPMELVNTSKTKLIYRKK